MTKIPTRAEMARKNEERETDYREPNALDMPEAPPGVTYRWIRAEIRGEDDVKSIRSRVAEGWEFVNPSELSEKWQSMTQAESGKGSGKFMMGDLVLMKIPTAKAEARQRFYEKRHRDQLSAIRNEANKDPRMNRYTPMYDESQSESRFYRQGRRTAIED